MINNNEPEPTIWQSGRESDLLDDIIAGKKTVEGRLNKGKFAKYKVGDIVSLRRDWRDTRGILHDGEPDVASVQIIKIGHYSSFLQMVQAEGYKNVIPSAKSNIEAANVYNQYYSAQDQAEYGVLGIKVNIIKK